MSDKYFFEYHIINILDVIKAVDACECFRTSEEVEWWRKTAFFNSLWLWAGVCSLSEEIFEWGPVAEITVSYFAKIHLYETIFLWLASYKEDTSKVKTISARFLKIPNPTSKKLSQFVQPYFHPHSQQSDRGVLTKTILCNIKPTRSIEITKKPGDSAERAYSVRRSIKGWYIE